MGEQELREKLKEDPDNPMNYYYLGKELLSKPIKNLSSIKEIEDLFKKSIELASNLWAPRIMLGELLYKQERYKEAEQCFRELLEVYPASVSAREYLTKCIIINSNSNGEVKETSQKDFLYLFENDIREFIKIILKNNYRNDWWRKCVPQKVRAKCAARREEGLDDEKEADLLLFADFYDYKEIIEHNKKFFVPYIKNIKKWGDMLSSMKPVRNIIAHNRPLPKTISIKDYCLELQKILNKVRNNISGG